MRYLVVNSLWSKPTKGPFKAFQTHIRVWNIFPEQNGQSTTMEKGKILMILFYLLFFNYS